MIMARSILIHFPKIYGCCSIYTEKGKKKMQVSKEKKVRALILKSAPDQELKEVKVLILRICRRDLYQMYKLELGGVSQNMEVSGENDASSPVGKKTILSTTFIGGPHDMRRRYMDAMALVQRFVDQECVALSKISHERTMIVATRVKVGSYNGISLLTKTSTSVLVNPNFTEANDLRTWCRIEVQLDDLSCRIVLSACSGEKAEAVFDCTSTKLMEEINQNGAFECSAGHECCPMQEIFQVKPCIYI